MGAAECHPHGRRSGAHGRYLLIHWGNRAVCPAHDTGSFFFSSALVLRKAEEKKKEPVS